MCVDDNPPATQDLCVCHRLLFFFWGGGVPDLFSLLSVAVVVLYMHIDACFVHEVQVQHALLDADLLYYVLYMRTDACFAHEGEAQHWDFGSWKATDPKRRGRLMRRWSCCPDFKVLRLC